MSLSSRDWLRKDTGTCSFYPCRGDQVGSFQRLTVPPGESWEVRDRELEICRALVADPAGRMGDNLTVG